MANSGGNGRSGTGFMVLVGLLLLALVALQTLLHMNPGLSNSFDADANRRELDESSSTNLSPPAPLLAPSYEVSPLKALMLTPLASSNTGHESEDGDGGKKDLSYESSYLEFAQSEADAPAPAPDSGNSNNFASPPPQAPSYVAPPVPTPAPLASSNTGHESGNGNGGKKGLSGGQKAGIALGIIFTIPALIVSWICWKRRSNIRRSRGHRAVEMM